MLNAKTQQLVAEMGLGSPTIFRDVDGPGIGNSAIAERIERPAEGGRLVHLHGYKYPYKGCPDSEGVYAIHDVKKVIHYALKAVHKKSVIAVLGLLFLTPNWMFEGIKTAIAEYFYGLAIEYKLATHLLKKERYCPCVRELYRTFDVLISRRKSGWMRKLLEMIRDILCMFFEYDSAYKFRLQDAFGAIDKKEVLKNVRAGVIHIFDVLIKRELDSKTKTGVGSKWKRLRKMFGLALLAPNIRSLAKEFIQELDFEKIKQDEGDWYFDLLRMDYNFGGKSLEERIKERKEIEGGNWINFEELSNNFIQNRNNFTKDVEAKFKRGV